MKKGKLILLFLLLAAACPRTDGQQPRSMFKNYFMKEVPDNRFGEIHISRDGSVLVSATAFSFAMISGAVYTPFSIGLSRTYHIRNIKNVFIDDPMRNIAESPDRNIFFTNSNNQISFFRNTETGYCDLAPFYFPPKGETGGTITKLWFDRQNNLYIGIAGDVFYFVPRAGTMQSTDSSRYAISQTSDSAMIIEKGELPVKKIAVEKAGAVNSFAQHSVSGDFIWVGTANGLYKYNKQSGEVEKVDISETPLTLTAIEVLPNGDTWFSTLENGIGVYHPGTQKTEFYRYTKPGKDSTTSFPVQHLSVKSPSEFFIAVKDSFPAIFNIRNRQYSFISDSFNSPHFTATRNNTTDIKMDTAGNFYFIKGGMLYSAHVKDHPDWVGETALSSASTPLIYQLKDLNNRLISDYYFQADKLKKIRLKHNQNSLIVFYTSNNFSVHDRTQFAWKLEGSEIGYWYEMPLLSNENDSTSRAELVNLKPGRYVLHVKMRLEGEDWFPNEARLEIIVAPPFWTTWWFWLAVIGGLFLVIYTVFRLRVRAVKRAERLRSDYQKELLELEAKALRVQMNPHFIFNCLNSIKALMQEKETDKGVTYLTTFSKLIRTLFNNADKKQITLYDEIETCKYYLMLEAMRFDSKFSYSVNMDPGIDLKSVLVPALIIQPFIENAIWHGIMPKGGGNVSLNVSRSNSTIKITVDDNGIGREASMQNKGTGGIAHQSKGINLTKTRLELDNLLQQRKAKFQITDKTDDAGRVTGTLVVITLEGEE